LSDSDGYRGTAILAYGVLSYWVVTVMEEIAVSWSVRVTVMSPSEDNFLSVFAMIPHSKTPG
jgi:hypothetical protein